MYQGISDMALGAILLCSLAADALPPPSPILSIEKTFKVLMNGYDEEVEGSIVWDATNCDHVLIIGTNSSVEACKGQLRAEGSFLIIAVGPGGATSEAVNNRVTRKIGTGRHGVIYRQNTDFDPDVFFDRAYKDRLRTKRSQEEIVDIVIRVLQAKGHNVTVGARLAQGGKLLFTATFNSDRTLDTFTDGTRNPQQVKRQIGYVVWIGPTSGQQNTAKRPILVLPVVMLNYPRDNDKWEIDPDGAQIGLPLCKRLVNDIATEAK